MKDIEKKLDRLAPEKAMALVTAVARNLFSQVSEQARLDFIYALTGDAPGGSGADLVHL